MELNIGHNDSQGYFVYDRPGETLFIGSYTRCLIVVGAVHLGKSLDEAIIIASLPDITGR